MAGKPGGTAELEVGLPQDPIPMRELQAALARAVAKYEVPDPVIAKIAERLSGVDLRIRGLDVCSHGICIDYFTTDDRWLERLSQLLTIEDSSPYQVTVLINGIPKPDLFHVRVEQQFGALAKYVGSVGH
jgi:hypothetical protein